MRHIIALFLSLLVLATFCQAQPNLALNKPVTLNGSFPVFSYPGNLCGVNPPQPPASIVTNGVFLPEGTCFQSGIYWSNQNQANTVDIDLQGTFLISAATVQADDNDTYVLQYRDPGGVYHDWWDIPTAGTFGLITRPDPTNPNAKMSLPAVFATGLRFFAPAGSGDGFYAVNQIQVFGATAQDAPFQVTYAANLVVGESYIDIINTGANGASLQGPGLGGAVGNVCVNVYAIDPGEELVACCSCLVTPDQVVNLGVNRDLTSKTLTGVIPTSLTIKTVATLSTGSCNNSATVAATPVQGVAAYSTTLHARAGTFDTLERPFTPSTLSLGEYQSLTGRCASIVGNGSGFGICSSCRAGALGGQKQ